MRSLEEVDAKLEEVEKSLRVVQTVVNIKGLDAVTPAGTLLRDELGQLLSAALVLRWFKGGVDD